MILNKILTTVCLITVTFTSYSELSSAAINTKIQQTINSKQLPNKTQVKAMIKAKIKGNKRNLDLWRVFKEAAYNNIHNSIRSTETRLKLYDKMRDLSNKLGYKTQEEYELLLRAVLTEKNLKEPQALLINLNETESNRQILSNFTALALHFQVILTLDEQYKQQSDNALVELFEVFQLIYKNKTRISERISEQELVDIGIAITFVALEEKIAEKTFA